MVFTVEKVQEEILAHAKAQFPAQKVVEKAWRDAELVPLVNGKVPVYISIEFGDPQPTKQHSAIGVWGDNHVMPISFFAMSPTPEVTRKLSNRIFQKMLGFSTDYAGELKKRAGGQIMPLVASNGAMEGYSVLIMFDISIQLADV